MREEVEGELSPVGRRVKDELENETEREKRENVWSYGGRMDGLDRTELQWA